MDDKSWGGSLEIHFSLQRIDELLGKVQTITKGTDPDEGHRPAPVATEPQLLDGGARPPGFGRSDRRSPGGITRCRRSQGFPHTPWRLLEHIGMRQWDILRFSVDPKHVSPDFPAGYWPEGDAPPDPGSLGPECRGVPGGPPGDEGPDRGASFGPVRHQSPTARARRSSARPYSWPITTPITWDRWSRSAVSSPPGTQLVRPRGLPPVFRLRPFRGTVCSGVLHNGLKEISHRDTEITEKNTTILSRLTIWHTEQESESEWSRNTLPTLLAELEKDGLLARRRLLDN